LSRGAYVRRVSLRVADLGLLAMYSDARRTVQNYAVVLTRRTR